MADTAVEDKLVSLEVRLAKLEGTVEARERDLPSGLDRIEAKVDRIPWFLLASWLTVMLALIGGFYLG
jgi:hypothetical protein